MEYDDSQKARGTPVRESESPCANADISVLIPVYNGGAFLGEAIASVLVDAQHVREIVIMDNASTDNTEAVVRSFTDPRIRYERKTALVPAWQNWTDLSRLAAAPLTKVLCADDRLIPNSLGAQRAALHRFPTASSAIGRKRVITAAGHALSLRSGVAGGSATLMPWHIALKDVLLAGGNSLGEPACVLFRTDVLQASLPWSPTWHFLLDLDMYSRAFAGTDIALFDDVHAEFRISGGSWSNALKNTQTSEFLAWARTIEASNDLTLTSSDWRRIRLATRTRSRCRRIAYTVARGIDRLPHHRRGFPGEKA